MKNEQLRHKIIKKLNNKSCKLSIPLQIENEQFTHVDKDVEGNWYIHHETWEIGLHELTNRELCKLYRIILKSTKQ